jgi:hypothetical protein
MATTDHVCRACGHGWLSNTNDSNCELCGSDDVHDWWDEDEWDWTSDETEPQPDE